MEHPKPTYNAIPTAIPLEVFTALGGKLKEGTKIVTYDDKNEPIHWSFEESKEYSLEMLSKYRKHNVIAHICLWDKVIESIEGSIQDAYSEKMSNWNLRISELGDK